MKKIAFALVAGLALGGSAFAGKEIKDFKPVVEPCFKDQELQLDVFGTYTNTQGGGNSDGFGGGLGVNYFFMRHLGVGIDTNLRDGGNNTLFDATARLIARFPLELGSVCLAPYLFAGGGVEAGGGTVGTGHVGGGLEWRATPSFGVFGEGRYTWAGGPNDAAQARLGIRFVF